MEHMGIWWNMDIFTSWHQGIPAEVPQVPAPLNSELTSLAPCSSSCPLVSTWKVCWFIQIPGILNDFNGVTGSLQEHTEVINITNQHDLIMAAFWGTSPDFAEEFIEVKWWGTQFHGIAGLWISATTVLAVLCFETPEKAFKQFEVHIVYMYIYIYIWCTCNFAYIYIYMYI